MDVDVDMDTTFLRRDLFVQLRGLDFAVGISISGVGIAFYRTKIPWCWYSHIFSVFFPFPFPCLSLLVDASPLCFGWE